MSSFRVSPRSSGGYRSFVTGTYVFTKVRHTPSSQGTVTRFNPGFVGTSKSYGCLHTPTWGFTPFQSPFFSLLVSFSKSSGGFRASLRVGQDSRRHTLDDRDVDWVSVDYWSFTIYDGSNRSVFHCSFFFEVFNLPNGFSVPPWGVTELLTTYILKSFFFFSKRRQQDFNL